MSFWNNVIWNIANDKNALFFKDMNYYHQMVIIVKKGIMVFPLTGKRRKIHLDDKGGGRKEIKTEKFLKRNKYF